jgi:hypothetical protein
MPVHHGSCRLRELFEEQIVTSHADPQKIWLRHYGRMRERGVVFTASVTYEMPAAKIELNPSMPGPEATGRSAQ